MTRFAWLLVVAAPACGGERSDARAPRVAAPVEDGPVDASVGSTSDASATPRREPSIATPEAIATKDDSPCDALARSAGDGRTVVFVEPDLVCFGNVEAKTPQTVTRHAQHAAKMTKSRAVTVYAGASVPHGRVLEILDALRAGGLDEVSLAVAR